MVLQTPLPPPERRINKLSKGYLPVTQGYLEVEVCTTTSTLAAAKGAILLSKNVTKDAEFPWQETMTHHNFTCTGRRIKDSGCRGNCL
jgi:hypothetical protein